MVLMTRLVRGFKYKQIQCYLICLKNRECIFRRGICLMANNSGPLASIRLHRSSCAGHSSNRSKELNMPATGVPTTQAPIGSGFGPTTTARQVLEGIDLTDRVAIVTGGYTGIGLETTRALAEAGATVIVPARTPEKARQALSNVPRVEHANLDLLDPASIDAFANELLATRRALHILINNAGI